MDGASRAVLAWRLSNPLDVAFCVEALEGALARHGRPAIFNTDQGAQFTPPPSPAGWPRPASRSAWTAAAAGSTTCSSSGLWRSLKYEEVHLKAYADGREARAGIGAWIAFNERRPHQALANRTPTAVWRTSLTAVDMTLRLDGADASATSHSRNTSHRQLESMIGGEGAAPP